MGTATRPKRPFKGLRNAAESSEYYDAVIIGAGIGGLVLGNLLGRQGLKVLLVEQHYMVGGYCSTFRRKGYIFDAATHFYPLLGNPDTITGKLLREIGVSTEWVKMDPVDNFHLPDGSSFSVPADFDSYHEKLVAQFPDEVDALRGFFDEARQVYLHGLLHYFRGKHTSQLDDSIGRSLKDVLDGYFKSRKLKLLLTADCPHWGTTPSRTSFVFDSMLRLSYFLGNYYPVGGSQSFADELALRFEESGGDLLLRSLAVKIETSAGRATGVVVETGPSRKRVLHRVRTGTVISNGDLLSTLENMLESSELPAGYLASIRKLRPTYPCFLAHLGLKDMSTDVLRRIHGYHWNEWDPEEVGTSALKFKIFVPTLYEPRMAPAGGHIIIVQKVTRIDYDSVDDWAVHKAGLEDYVIRGLKELVPDLDSKVVVRSSASALTSHRFTLNYRGAMLGWDMAPDQLGDNRPDVVSPIENLLFVGHWTKPGGGITPVIVSAMQVADLILDRTDPPSRTSLQLEAAS